MNFKRCGAMPDSAMAFAAYDLPDTAVIPPNGLAWHLLHQRRH